MRDRRAVIEKCVAFGLVCVCPISSKLQVGGRKTARMAVWVVGGF